MTHAGTSVPLPSIQGRLMQALLAIALLTGLALVLMVGVLLHRAVDEVLDGGLQESAELLYGALSVGDEGVLSRGGMLPAPPHAERVVWQWIRPDGTVALRSHHAPAQALAPPMQPGFLHGGRWRIYSLPLTQGRGVLLVAQPEATRVRTQVLILGGTLGLVLLVGLLSTAWMRVRLRRELRPLQDLSEAVGRFDPLRQGSSLPAPARAELVPMRAALDDLGQRLVARVAHERAFAAHAAHALRTPLAGIDAQLAVAVREASPERQPRLRQVREAAARLRSVVSALIGLFRAGGDLNRQRVKLADLLAYLPVTGVAVQVETDAVILCDPDLLSAALLNVLDNAARHQATALRVSVRTATTSAGSAVEILLKDNGEGMSPERLRAVQAALQTGQGEGVLGLGLTLVDLVARKHGGQVEVSCGSEAEGAGPGCRVRLTLLA